MKKVFGTIFVAGFICCMTFMLAGPAQAAAELEGVNLEKRQLVVHRGFTKEAKSCIECHSQKTPGIVENWKNGKMGHATVSCYDCHVVEKDSPMASQCEGLRGTNIYTSPMVSSKTCSKCHPREVEQFLKSNHAMNSGRPLLEVPKFIGLMYHHEGAEFLGVEKGSAPNRASRAAGCQMCHGTQVELGPDHKPINDTWPGGVGTRYPDGSVGNCTVCHTRHQFAVSEARKPEACASCHLGPDHPQIEIYEESKHGQIYKAHSEKWNFEAAPDTWEPGDYDAPTCAVCHMSGIGELTTTHNVAERLKWDLVHARSELRKNDRGNGMEGDKKMRQVCKSCHSTLHTNSQRMQLDNAVALYNTYWDKAVEMKTVLQEKNLLGKDPWTDGFQELMYFLWHHCGRRARHGTAMNGPDYAHWHGFFQVFQVYKDMKAIYDYRLKTGQIEELSTVMSTAPD
ncbi:multiheme c-type cytochrome [Pseudodesulfovibrio piezophilus]|uniref:Hydroxylamine oxidase n=1 Tax=Pseudodesulfovibrio piezophilus (strain DSM 21447 / JCM 15486 / C1TLV30) TaxID=1322246 RepID=M1WS80_PSEP2|nr:multiheme c-type cytochrome [Pseudodesulfovibrio piezophilus]CCH50024.1 Hydroxylamine oxidase [Pseudodesulfovibrio piezophilus C1TLV30]